MPKPRTSKSPSPTDAHVGKRVSMRRKMLSMSQTDLGAALGLTFQQIQKYEKGTNRIGAGRLQEIADTLRVPISFFSTTRSSRRKEVARGKPARRITSPTFSPLRTASRWPRRLRSSRAPGSAAALSGWSRTSWATMIDQPCEKHIRRSLI
jgi:transcriptional regulator with XRE-family HTH domain